MKNDKLLFSLSFILVLNFSICSMNVTQIDRNVKYNHTVYIDSNNRIVSRLTNEYHELQKLDNDNSGLSYIKYLTGTKKDKIKGYVVVNNQKITTVEVYFNMPELIDNNKDVFIDLLSQFDYSNYKSQITSDKLE